MFKVLFSLLIIQFSYGSSLPQNNILRPVIEKSSHHEEVFFSLISRIEDIYSPLIESHGKKFVIDADWENPKVNAAAGVEGDNYKFMIFGGLYRFETISDDAFLLVACHEMGHLLGGAPTYKPFNDGSSEGQADYFSINKCFKKVVRGDDHEKLIKGTPLNPLALSECAESFLLESEDYLICLRSSIAIVDMAKTFKALSGMDKVPEVDTPDPYEIMFTIFNGYPNPQCRVDTLFAGSLCQVSIDIDNDFDLKLYNKGNCSVDRGDTRGLRPRCWYVPRSEENE